MTLRLGKSTLYDWISLVTITDKVLQSYHIVDLINSLLTHPMKDK